jgi:hypothetical protein
VTAVAGDGGVLAYALAKRASSSVGIVPRFWRGVPVAQTGGRALALAVDGGRIATLGDHGTLTVSTRGGRPAGALRVGAARAIALRGDTVAVLSGRGTLDLYRAGSGRLLHSWRAPRDATSIDLQYGIALLGGGRDVYAMNVRTGRTALLFHAPTRVAAQIESPGAVLQFNAGGRGYLRFLPMSLIEASAR